MHEPPWRVLIVDADVTSAAPLARYLESRGRFTVSTAFGVDDAHELLGTELPDAVLLDMSLSLSDGHALLARLRRGSGRTVLPVFLIVRRHDDTAIRAATRAGAMGFILQPLDAAEISYKIEQAVRDNRARAAEVADLLLPNDTRGDVGSTQVR